MWMPCEYTLDLAAQEGRQLVFVTGSIQDEAEVRERNGGYL